MIAENGRLSLNTSDFLRLDGLQQIQKVPRRSTHKYECPRRIGRRDILSSDFRGRMPPLNF
jgi:hypothetical protein